MNERSGSAIEQPAPVQPGSCAFRGPGETGLLLQGGPGPSWPASRASSLPALPRMGS